MKKLLLTTLSLLTLIFTTGCSVTPKYRVTVDAITAPNITLKTKTTYNLESLSKNKNSLEFQRFSSKLSAILQEEGLLQAYDKNSAQQTIYFDYGIEKINEESRTYIEPNLSVHVGWGYPFYGGYYRRHYYPYWSGIYRESYTTYRKNYIYYNRYITLLAKDSFSRELWRVDVSSIGESKNLKKIIPILIEATEPYLGTNTKEPIKLIIKDIPLKKK